MMMPRSEHTVLWRCYRRYTHRWYLMMMTVYCCFITSMMPRSEHTVLKRENTFYLYVRDHMLYVNL